MNLKYQETLTTLYLKKKTNQMNGLVVSIFSLLVSAATDKTVALWDVEVGERIKKLKGHTTFVNSCQIARRGPQLICSGSDDGTIKVCVFVHVYT